MGDFNFDSSWKNEQCNIDKEYDDIYLTLNKNEETFTMPKTPYFKAWRPDKILCRKSSQFVPESISLIGKFCIPSYSGSDLNELSENSVVGTPSDHYGLFAVFKFQEK